MRTAFHLVFALAVALVAEVAWAQSTPIGAGDSDVVALLAGAGLPAEPGGGGAVVWYRGLGHYPQALLAVRAVEAEGWLRFTADTTYRLDDLLPEAAVFLLRRTSRTVGLAFALSQDDSVLVTAAVPREGVDDGVLARVCDQVARGADEAVALLAAYAIAAEASHEAGGGAAIAPSVPMSEIVTAQIVTRELAQLPLASGFALADDAPFRFTPPSVGSVPTTIAFATPPCRFAGMEERVRLVLGPPPRSLAGLEAELDFAVDAPPVGFVCPGE